MVIQKYTKAELYGFGFIEGYRYGYDDYGYKFTEEVTIGHGMRFDMGMKPITLKRKNSLGNLQDVKQPIYLVEDDGVWKEYFSGSEVKYLQLYAYDRPHLIDEYELSRYWGGDDENNKFKGIREFVFGDKGNSQPELMEAQDFANEISQYSEAEIKNMVGQFLKLKENAATWGAKFDKAVEEFTKSYDSKNEMASRKLADGMGKYANVQPGFTDEIQESVHASVHSSFTDEIQESTQSASTSNNEEKKSVNKIIIFLVIFAVVIAFLWIIK